MSVCVRKNRRHRYRRQERRNALFTYGAGLMACPNLISFRHSSAMSFWITVGFLVRGEPHLPRICRPGGSDPEVRRKRLYVWGRIPNLTGNCRLTGETFSAVPGQRNYHLLPHSYDTRLHCAGLQQPRVRISRGKFYGSLASQHRSCAIHYNDDGMVKKAFTSSHLGCRLVLYPFFNFEKCKIF